MDFLYQYQLAYNLSLVALFGWVLFPDWYFQGIEKMETITYVMVSTKLISLILIILLVKSVDDYIVAIAINCFSMLIAGIFGVILALKSSKVLNFQLPTFVDISKQFKSGFAYFFSNISANTKDYLNTFIIGYFFSYSEVGVYDLIIKIIKMLLIPITILSKAVFPKVSVEKSFSLNKKLNTYC
nr:oligosaccharide flippase family protein [Polaribacter filamentus]